MFTFYATGNLGYDAQPKVINDKRYTVFSIAVTINKDYPPQWVSCVLLDPENRFCSLLKKGTKVLIAGKPYASIKTNAQGTQEPVLNCSLMYSGIEILKYPEKEPINDLPK